MATAAVAAGALLGLPNLSTGAAKCRPGTRLTAQKTCVASGSSALRSFRAAAPRQAATDPTTTPPLHGTNPHGQGTVAVIDTNPDPKRPYSEDPTGTTDNEDIVVGRSRGEQRADGTYHGHITVAALFGNEIVGVDTNPGETKQGPLDAVQQNILTPLCDGSGNQICLTAVTVSSTTTTTGSTNKFSVAHVTLGGATGIDAGAAESNGNISSDGTCQTSHGDSTVADVKAGGMAVASVGKSTTDSKACKGQAPTQTNTSSVIALGGTGVPLPAPGCDDGTPDTVTGIPTVLPLVCNADDTNAGQTSNPYGVREALDAFVLATGTTAAAKLTTAASESHAVAPGDQIQPPNQPPNNNNNNDNNGTANNNAKGKPECSDKVDNDGDGLVDEADPGCHTDGNANNAASFNPNDNDESNGNQGTKNANANGAPQCSDNVDNDGDGVIDEADPGCHSDGNANNPASYNPNDDSEANGGVRASSGKLPFTGTDLLMTGLIGALLLAGGLAIRTQLGRRFES